MIFRINGRIFALKMFTFNDLVKVQLTSISECTCGSAGLSPISGESRCSQAKCFLSTKNRFLAHRDEKSILFCNENFIVILPFPPIILIAADISNWNSVQNASSNSVAMLEPGGFYAFGVDGVFRGVVIILLLFTAFDLMVFCRWFDIVWLPHHSFDKQQTIQHFSQTITTAILSINTALFLSLLGMAFALTAIQPLHSMVS